MKKFDFKILVVEDSKLINTNLCSYLEKSTAPTFDIYSVMNLEDARYILETEEIDFVILDLELPDGQGEELVEFIKDKSTLTEAKIIVLTSSAEKTRRDKLFEMGIIDYLSKDNPMNFLSNEIAKSIVQFTEHKKYKILIVDDSKFFANFVAKILINQNYTVTTCLHSKEVVALLKADPVHLLVTDLEMPELSGIELLRQIREDDQLLDLPIIGMSGTNNQDLITRVLKSGANDFLAKPFSIETFLLKIDVTLTLYKKKRTLMELNECLHSEVERNVEEVRSKDQLLELENRHSQMGQMMGSLIHQWKQPLNGISLSADYIKMIKGDDEVLDSVQTIQDQVQFLAETMEYFRDFFKPSKNVDEFSVIGAFENVMKLLGDTYSEIDISIEGDRSLAVKGHTNEFYQIIINLLNNAQDAFIDTNMDVGKVEVKVEEDSNETLLITVSDNAGGIPGEIMSSIFEQYTSTKDKRGTGIGLHMSRSVIQKMGGVIDVCNRKEGACFSMVMPLIRTKK
jgi:two-component system, sensor histidine kinase and response regulator